MTRNSRWFRKNGAILGNEKDLVRRIQNGDPSACAECIDLHADGVYRIASRLLGDAVEAEDVVQDTFMKAFMAIDGFESRSKLSTWLYRIAYNEALMRMRRSSPELVSVDEPMISPDGDELPRQLFDWCCLPEEDFETKEARQELERAIHELPDKLRAVFVLRELEGVPTRDTALILAVNEGVVKTRLHRARLLLRERLSQYFTDYARRRLEA